MVRKQGVSATGGACAMAVATGWRWFFRMQGMRCGGRLPVPIRWVVRMGLVLHAQPSSRGQGGRMGSGIMALLFLTTLQNKEACPCPIPR